MTMMIIVMLNFDAMMMGLAEHDDEDEDDAGDVVTDGT